MPTKSYNIQEDAPMTVAEPAVAYRKITSVDEPCNQWNPNVPFHGTQEEWWEHFHRIEEGPFYTIEEANEEFEIWKKKLLASRM